MSDKVLMKGAEALAEGAIQAGCRYYFGYPITPQNETPEYMSRRLPEVGGRFVQAESEVASINMVYGAACAGVRVMTSSSSPGISLMQEGISYISGSNVPCVVMNAMRGGPGLGNIAPAQADYFQAVKGGGNGDYKRIVFAPSSIQEGVDLFVDAFELADKYRMVVMVIVDGLIGQMMEPVEFKTRIDVSTLKTPEWATVGRHGRDHANIITSLTLDAAGLEQWNLKLQAKYAQVELTESRIEEYQMDDADYAIIAYGTMARIAKTTIRIARAKGIKLGLLRPITVWPFPAKQIQTYVGKLKGTLTVELAYRQLFEDVQLALCGKIPLGWYGRGGGVVPGPQEILAAFEEQFGKGR
ncbi:3-methyl-2-oxobutanoate dehydrogenase subunit VorB [Candidatus Cryosericum septentrionale]|jgi:2-oxoglutarate ferredoxin oxidoreductase subunit alpha|uniref:3-methyl-2-oxobutanoate dehydrogenase subunit VorB n=1 Tax=Candidatus Cryosericum septentrionale TaxID=2290913 RepID=A0A398DPV5_9BACT|nr:3-methyl-2-oxobutanoate dehydrogenase subunit VorB [Candidatus Cryosericum septentrionale]RIE17726.1 3-methyl-2-oxobutanoate dehydrogenase subunit VorB [Candidatus Cryosericum septentrionale]